MKKEGLVEALAEKTGKTKTDAKKFLDAFVQVVTETLAKGEEVNITGFGRFYIRERSERVGRNPRTGEQITIPAGKTPAFSAGNVLKKALKS